MAERFVRIRVHPKAKQAGVENSDSGVLKVHVNAPPDKDRANREVIKRVAAHFGLPPSRVTITRGRKSRDKVIVIRLEDPND